MSATEFLKDTTNIILALPALLAALGTLIAALRGQKQQNKQTREAASKAAPSIDMLIEELNETQAAVKELTAVEKASGEKRQPPSL